ncbi:MAG: class B sortase, partial [Lachnospiraceae bacterium]|nr:class B sortase [Lachnospiraceae bacterium]
EEYDKALEDRALIRIIRRENDLEDPAVAKQVYDKLRFQEGVLKSPIGKSFFYELSAVIAKGEEEEKRKKALRESGEQEEKRSSFVWPSDEEPVKPRSNKRAWLILVAVASVLVLFFCVYKIVAYELMTAKSTRDIDELKAMIGSSQISIENTEGSYRVSQEETVAKNDDGVLLKYEELYNLNKDMVGWVSIENTNIDYPVMQNLSSDEYYLHLGFDGKESDEGLPFLDWRCRSLPISTNSLIYGHNMKNGHMFADLLKYEDEEFFKEHRLIRYDTVYEEGFYDIVAVFRTHVAYEAEDAFRFYRFIDADNSEEFDDYISKAKELSLYETGVSAQYGDMLLTLSTCEYTEQDGRFVVVAKKIS